MPLNNDNAEAVGLEKEELEKSRKRQRRKRRWSLILKAGRISFSLKMSWIALQNSKGRRCLEDIKKQQEAKSLEKRKPV